MFAGIGIADFIARGPPAGASAIGCTRIAYVQDFRKSANMDLGHTNAAGYDWYKSDWFDAGKLAAGGTAWPSPASDGDITVAGSEVRCSGYQADTRYRPRIATAQVTGPSSYIGTTFSPLGKVFIEVGHRYDPKLCLAAYASPQQGWCGAGWWNDPLLMLTSVTPGTVRAEIDFSEAFPLSDGAVSQFFAVHKWSANGDGSATHITNNSYDQTSTVNAMNLDWTKRQRIGIAIVDKASNGGNGFLKHYVNDTNISGADVTWTAASTWDCIEDGNYVQMFEGGPSWPNYMDYTIHWRP